MNHRILLLILFGFVCGCSTQSFRFAAPPGPITVPLIVDTNFNGVPHSGKAYMRVGIEDTSLLLFLDLGNFSTIALNSDVLNHLQIRVIGKTTSSDAFGKASTLRNYIVPSCRISSLTCSDMAGSEMQTQLSGSSAGCVGSAFLCRFNVIFDYPHRMLLFLQDALLPEAYHHQHWLSMPYYVSNGHCVTTDATINGKKRTFIWDTGASFSVIRPDVIGDTSGVRKMVTLADLATNGQKIAPIQFVTLPFVEPDADALIGHNFFLDHIIFLNSVERTLSIAE